MRILAIDYGKKRIGIAVSDPLGMTARPLKYLENNKDIFNNIKILCSEYEVSKIIIGLPKTLKGEISFSAQDVRKFTVQLKKAIDIPIEEWDERLTTKIAENMLIAKGASREKRKGSIDSVAAALMLEEYLKTIDH